jgi:heterodisulfide reductase subunit A
VAPPNGKRVAIVGSGPAGLTAAWQLARRGYGVKILEAAPEPGGFLRLAIPAYRLPAEVVAKDITNVTDIGVELVTNSPVRDLLALRRDGFDAVLVATGTPRSTSLGIPGEESSGVIGGVEFLRDVRLDQATDLAGRRVVVVGGGNVAMDAARTTRRLGAASVTVAYRRGREEMPAHGPEIDDAEREGVWFAFLAAPVDVAADPTGAVRGLTCTKMALGAPDASGRRRPEPIAGSEFTMDCEVVIAAIGMAPDTRAFADIAPTNGNGTLRADPTTLQTGADGIFAAGDVVTGPSDITRAVGEGRRAAHMIDRWLTGGALTGFDDRLPVVDKQQVVARQQTYALRVAPPAHGASDPAPRDFDEIEPPMTEAEAHEGAARCMDCAVCSECEECVKACPVPGCIDLHARDEELDVDVDAVVLATGFNLFAADLKPDRGGELSQIAGMVWMRTAWSAARLTAKAMRSP